MEKNLVFGSRLQFTFALFGGGGEGGGKTPVTGNGAEVLVKVGLL